jgi:hypothetical protein
MPEIVPPVPTPTTKCVILPSVCSQISGPFVQCAKALEGLSYWLTYQNLVSVANLLETE